MSLGRLSKTSFLVHQAKTCLILLDASEELALLLVGLESSVSDLGGGIDELQVDLLECGSLGLHQERLAEGHASLLGSHDGTLDHQPVLVNLTVVRAATHRRDVLLRQIVGSGRVVLVLLLSDLVDLLVDLGTVVVSVLTGARHLELNAGRMPGSDTGDLAETTMRLTRQAGNTPTSHDTVNSATLGNTDDVDHLILGKDITD